MPPTARPTDVDFELERACDLQSPEYFLEHRLNLEITPVHSAMLRFQHRFPRTLILGPRGIGKSSVCVLGYSLSRLLTDPNRAFLICSKSAKLAYRLLGTIEDIMEFDDRFRTVHGEWRGPEKSWSQTEMIVSRRTDHSKLNPTYSAMGLFSMVTGRHPDELFLDDIIDEDVSRTEVQREKIEDYVFTTLFPVASRALRAVGTRYYRTDLYARFLEHALTITRPIWRANGELGWRTRFSPAARRRREQGEDISDMQLRAMIVPALLDGRPICPERLPIERLRSERLTLGPYRFAAQYLNEILDAETLIFRPEWFGTFARRGHDLVVGDPVQRIPLDSLDFYIGIDPAPGKMRAKNDYFAACVLGEGRAQNLYVFECVRGRLTIDQQEALIHRLYEKWSQVGRVRAVGIEEASYQDTLRQHLRITSRVPVRPVSHSSNKDKVARAYKVQPWFENRKVFFEDSPALRPLIEELIAFPDLDYDDRPDAFLIACETANERRGHRLVFLNQEALSQDASEWLRGLALRPPAWV